MWTEVTYKPPITRCISASGYRLPDPWSPDLRWPFTRPGSMSRESVHGTIFLIFNFPLRNWQVPSQCSHPIARAPPEPDSIVALLIGWSVPERVCRRGRGGIDMCTGDTAHLSIARHFLTHEERESDRLVLWKWEFYSFGIPERRSQPWGGPGGWGGGSGIVMRNVPTVSWTR